MTVTPSSPLTAADERFTEGVRTLRVGGATIRLSERILLVVASVVAPLGLVLVLLGYLGAARTPYLFEQISYLISGGLFGLALVFLGSFFYFAHWMTQLVKEHRVQSAAVLDALQRLQEEMARHGATIPGAATNGRAVPSPADDGELVATAKGTMAHRPDCVAVVGRSGLRRVAPGEDLAPCKLCGDVLADGA